ncbi:MAG: signal peptide peptidase SppA [Candidatus Adiutrix sp.]
MKPEDWQAYQAGRNASENQAPSASPKVTANPYGSKAPSPSKKTTMGWPMAFLLLGLAILGSCTYSLGNLATKFDSISSLSNEPGIGVLVIESEIMGSVWATTVLNRFNDDPKIKAVVIRINSPGGSVAPCQEIYQAIKNTQKPVIVSMGSIAASGGLYIAAAGDLILANPGTITGSIGVIMQSVEISGTMEKIGLKTHVIKSGQFKDMGSPFREMEINERELLQQMVTEVYEQFVNDLSAGRPKLDKSEVRKLADGRIYNGEEAARLGLIDELGTFEDAVRIATKMGGLPTDKRPKLTMDDGRRPWWESIISSKKDIGLTVPPSLMPGLSMKFIYQPDLGANIH